MANVGAYVNGMIEAVRQADRVYLDSGENVEPDNEPTIPVRVPRNAMMDYVNEPENHVASIELAQELCRRFDRFNSGLPAGDSEHLKINFFTPIPGLFQSEDIYGITHIWRFDSDGKIRRKQKKPIPVQGKRIKIEEVPAPDVGAVAAPVIAESVTVTVSELDNLLENLNINGGGKRLHRKSRKRTNKRRKMKRRTKHYRPNNR